jgi:hypothetical protein
MWNRKVDRLSHGQAGVESIWNLHWANFHAIAASHTQDRIYKTLLLTERYLKMAWFAFY